MGPHLGREGSSDVGSAFVVAEPVLAAHQALDQAFPLAVAGIVAFAPDLADYQGMQSSAAAHRAGRQVAFA